MAVPHRAGRDPLAPEAYRLQFLASLNSNSNLVVGAHSGPGDNMAVTESLSELLEPGLAIAALLLKFEFWLPDLGLTRLDFFFLFLNLSSQSSSRRDAIFDLRDYSVKSL